MIVAIDGPAGAGKSSVARALARRLNFRFLDTGAMYRAVTLAALQRQVPLDDSYALAELVRSLKLRLTDDEIWLDDTNISDLIRTPEVTRNIKHIADNLQVRAQLSALQRNIAEGGCIVTEGRDQGTAVFPQAECKIFLTASPEERARRRYEELRSRGTPLTYDDILAQQSERDQQDAERPVGGLRQAEDACVVVSDELTPAQVVDRMEEIVRERIALMKS
ncbi:MAG: (d)CMP kinase [Planctomycetales bacterium]|nr:(d)CMP kinase [Planctomycetales bacterium]